MRMELLAGKVFDKKKNKKHQKEETNRDFGTRRFCTLAMALVHPEGLDSFGIDEKRQVNL